MSSVVIKDCSHYDIDLLSDRINTALEDIGGWDRYVKKGMKVLLKVNLIGPKTSETGAVTHSEFVRAVTRVLKKKGCTVWIGDSAGGAIAGIAPTKQSFITSGLAKVAEEEGAQIKNFDKEGVIEVYPESGLEETMYLAKPMYEADLVINLPKLKTHTAGIYTGAVKNLFGCVPGLKKAYYHKLAPNPREFGKILVDIHRATEVALHIMDGVIAMEGEGPTAGGVYQGHKILISTDPLALDTVASKMIGIAIEDIPILESARTRQLGIYDLNSIEIKGDYTEIPKLHDFKLPKKFKNNRKQNYGALVKVIDFLKTRPVIDLKICKDCKMCVDSCPVQAIDKDNKNIDYKACIECMCCHELCMHQAVKLKRINFFANILTKLYRGHYK